MSDLVTDFDTVDFREKCLIRYYEEQRLLIYMQSFKCALISCLSKYGIECVA